GEGARPGGALSVGSSVMNERSGRALRTKLWRSAVALSSCTSLLCALGCDEKPTPSADKAAPVESAAPVVPPAPAVEPEPEPAPAPKKAKKTLADCDKGNKVVLDSPEFEGAVRVKAQKPDGDLTTADLKKLRSL